MLNIPFRSDRNGRKISYRHANRYEAPPCSTSAKISACFDRFGLFRPVYVIRPEYFLAFYLFFLCYPSSSSSFFLLLSSFFFFFFLLLSSFRPALSLTLCVFPFFFFSPSPLLLLLLLFCFFRRSSLSLSLSDSLCNLSFLCFFLLSFLV